MPKPSFFFTFLPMLIISWLFHNSHSNKWPSVICLTTRYFIMVLICISLMLSDIEHIFMYPPIMIMSSLKKYWFQSSVRVLIGWIFFNIEFYELFIYSWPLNNMDLNYADPLRHNYFSTNIWFALSIPISHIQRFSKPLIADLIHDPCSWLYMRMQKP